MERAVIYCRCSTEEESQKDALRKQEEEAVQCVQSKGWILIDRYVESRSGTSTKGRIEYNRLFEDLLTDKFDILVIKSQDRLMRNTMDWYIFIDRLNRNGKKLYIYIENKFYTSDDTLITGIKAILAEDYSHELSKKIVNAHRNRQKNGGKPILTSNTYAYRRNANGDIELIKEEADVKRRMYQLCAAGYGCRRIAITLYEDGVRNRKGKPFNNGDILRIIRNPMNKGTIVMNRKHYDFNSKRTIRNPPEEYFVYNKKIPAIVSEQLWEDANRAIDERAIRGNNTGSYSAYSCPGKYPLNGKLVCGECGAPYYRKMYRRYKDHEKVHIWQCSEYLYHGKRKNNDTGRGCDNFHFREEYLNTELEKVFSEQYKPDKEYLITHMVKLLREVLKENDLKGEIKREKNKKEQIKNQMNLLVDKLLEGVLSDQIYSQKQQELEKRLAETDKRIQELTEKSSSGIVLKERLNKIEQKLRNGSLLDQATVAGMLSEIEKIMIYPKKMILFLNFSKTLGLKQISEMTDQGSMQITVEYGNQYNYLEKKREDREQVVDLMRENPKITAKQIAEKLEISLSGANYRIRALKKEGRVCYHGAGGKGWWETKVDG